MFPVGVNPHLPPHVLLLELRLLPPLLAMGTPTIPAPLQVSVLYVTVLHDVLITVTRLHSYQGPDL